MLEFLATLFALSYLFSVESHLAILSRLEHQEPYVAVSPPGIYGNAWLFRTNAPDVAASEARR